jgi:hypothetical protein
MISIRSIRWRKKLVAKNETHRESCCINPLHFNLTLELLSLCLCKIWLFQWTQKKKELPSWAFSIIQPMLCIFKHFTN